MPHYVEDLHGEAQAAILAMREAALHARLVQAKAELIRHMRTTAAKVKDKPRDEAVEAVVAEWMEAWHLGREEWPDLHRDMIAFTQAFYDYVHQPDDAHDAAVRRETDKLEHALAARGTSIADEMAHRSMCAHRWWEMVSPTPADLPGRKERPTIPAYDGTQPFFAYGCAEQCR